MNCYINIAEEMITSLFGLCDLRENNFCVRYRTPNGNTMNFYEYRRRFFFVNDNKSNLICDGCFNINMLGNNFLGVPMNTIIDSNGCTNAITKPTRVTAFTSTLLDLLVSNIAA